MTQREAIRARRPGAVPDGTAQCRHLSDRTPGRPETCRASTRCSARVGQPSAEPFDLLFNPWGGYPPIPPRMPSADDCESPNGVHGEIARNPATPPRSARAMACRTEAPSGRVYRAASARSRRISSASTWSSASRRAHRGGGAHGVVHPCMRVRVADTSRSHMTRNIFVS